MTPSDNMSYFASSNMPAAPIPTQIHIVTMPYRVYERLRIFANKREVNTALFAPVWWPSAMAPHSDLFFEG